LRGGHAWAGGTNYDLAGFQASMLTHAWAGGTNYDLAGFQAGMLTQAHIRMRACAQAHTQALTS